MSSRPSIRTLLAASTLVVSFLAAPLTVQAGGVDEAERKVEQVLQDLDNLRNQLDQIDQDYGVALARQEELAVEIQASQARVDELSLELGGVESALQQIAVDRFTSGDTLGLSPIFSDADTYSQAEQRAALGLVAIDTGEGDIDRLQYLVDELADERAALDQKQQEATSLIATLEQQRIDFQALEEAYVVKEAEARAELGDARLQAEEERQAAAAAARAAEEAAAAAANSNNNGNTGNNGNVGGGTTTPRGGGGNTGGSGSGSGSGGGSTPTPPPTPAPTPAAPPVSGKAGTAVAAAYSQLGVPYKYATSSPGVNFDCSGLTKYAWGRAGVSLPHQSRAQYASVPHVSKTEAQPGDLIFYYSPIGHVGIYLGGGQMIHAPQTGDVVKISTVNWGKVVGVGRPG